jgi:hypothetical protein
LVSKHAGDGLRLAVANLGLYSAQDALGGEKEYPAVGRENAKKLAWLGEESRVMVAIVTQSREESSSCGF